MLGVMVCLLLAVAFVGSLYAWKQTHDRDHPETIKRRFISIFIVSLISPFVVWGVWSLYSVESFSMAWLGLPIGGGLLWPPQLIRVTAPTALTLIAFIGPLVQSKLDIGSFWGIDPNFWNDWVFWRNVIVAPASEEWVFRACMAPLLFAEGWSANQMIFLGPLFFGVAHAHHAVRDVRDGTIDVKSAVIRTLFQLTYTSLFGFYSMFLFLRTGSVVSAIVAHALCNSMGFPPMHMLPSHRRKVLLITLYIGGLVAFGYLLAPLTNPGWFPDSAYSSLWE